MSDVLQVFNNFMTQIEGIALAMHPSVRLLFWTAFIGHAVLLPMSWVLRKFFLNLK